MKLTKIYQNLFEIGDSVNIPSAHYKVGRLSGEYNFKIDDTEYICEIRFPFHRLKDEEFDISKIAAVVDFNSESNDEYSLTNKNIPLKLMSYIVGGFEMYITKWKKEYNNNEEVLIAYLKFNSQKESDEPESNNKRSNLYKRFIEKFATRHNSSVQFNGGVNSVIAKFEDLIL
jgi:hypothetical protein